ncbi:MAG: hypothetical protein ISP55_07540 [Flavobacteriales bacterium]|nr:hypothetical protein [Flavobacteriales bacterium]
MKHLYLFAVATLVAWSSWGQTVPVTFHVDMSNETVAAEGVHVAGNFQGWDPAITMLADDDMDGIYSVTVEVSDTLETINYKFLNGNAWGVDEACPEPCAFPSSSDRYADIDGATDLPVVCFGACAACGITTVMFKIDMSQEEAINPVGVHMNGNFNGWDGSNFLMMEDADGDMVYTYTAQIDGAALSPVDTVEFKFVNGNAWGFDENPDGECAAQGNRFLPLTGGDLVYQMMETGQPYCYNTCGSCVAPTPVTFRVDMSTQAAVSANGVCVAGSFQGWTPGANFLSDDDGDLVFEATIDVAPGDYEFKFINGNNWGGDGDGNIDNENPPGECTSNGNRTFSVGAEAIAVQYCYNQCSETCVADPDPAPITFQVDMTNETVSENGVWVIGGMTSPQWQAGALQLSDGDGDNVYEVTYEVAGAAFFEYRYCNGDPYPGGEVDDSVAEDGNFEEGGCGQGNPFGEYNRTHIRSGQPEVLGAYCYSSCLDCNGDTVGTVIGIEEVQDFIGLEVFPNPAQDVINIRMKGQEGLFKLRAYSLLGQQVLNIEKPMAQGEIVTFTTESWPKGVYVLEAQIGLRRSSIRLQVD